MRILIIAALVVLSTGCTHISLRRNTVKQASTVTDLQFQQVLGNLAMFSCSADAMPWHVRLQGGVVQVADEGSGSLSADVLREAQVTPALAAQRGISGQWSVEPVTEKDDLEALQLAYQIAISPGDLLVIQKIYDKICEISVTKHVVLRREVAEGLIASIKQQNIDRPEELHKIAIVEQQLKRLYDEVEGIIKEPISYEDYKLQVQGEGTGDRSAANRAAEPQVEFLKMQIVKLTSNLTDLPYLPSYARAERNVAVIEQAQDKVEALYKLVEVKKDETNPFFLPWVSTGCKKDVPKHCVCYVGQYSSCNGDCYAWIMTDQQKMLRDFTEIILALAPPDKQDMSFPTGLTFTPGFR